MACAPRAGDFRPWADSVHRGRTLRDYFPEFDEPSEFCRFTNCTHVHEPDCEVKERVDGGELNRARYETYARLWADLG